VRIAVIGTGYVGLVSGACFADFGHVVTCVDKDASKIRALRTGSIPIFEPGLERSRCEEYAAGSSVFETDAAPAVRSADAVFIAVGTPSRRGDGHADLSYVYEAAREIARELDGYTVVITNTNPPIG
jgi:UDPglucose 6-dehydrogenase